MHGSPIRPTHDQTVILYIVSAVPRSTSHVTEAALQTVVYTVVIFALWNIPGVRFSVLYAHLPANTGHIGTRAHKPVKIANDELA